MQALPELGKGDARYGWPELQVGVVREALAVAEALPGELSRLLHSYSLSHISFPSFPFSSTHLTQPNPTHRPTQTTSP